MIITTLKLNVCPVSRSFPITYFARVVVFVSKPINDIVSYSKSNGPNFRTNVDLYVVLAGKIK